MSCREAVGASRVALTGLFLLFLAGAGFAASESTPHSSRGGCRARFPEKASNVIAFQICRASEQHAIGEATTAELVNLNKNVGTWYLLRVWADGRRREFHLEVPGKAGTAVSLSPEGLLLHGSDGETPCPILTDKGELLPELLVPDDRKSHQAFVPLCGGRLLRRMRVPEGYESIETQVANAMRGGSNATRQMLRWAKRVPGVLGKPEKATVFRGDRAAESESPGPRPARIGEIARDLYTRADKTRLTFALAGGRQNLYFGRWYPARDRPGVFISVSDVSMLEGESPTDDKSKTSLNYFAAFDLGRYALAYAAGGQDPHPGWALAGLDDQVALREDLKEVTHATGGPSGFASSAPLVPLGMVPPYDLRRLAGVFKAGYYRADSMMFDGPLSKVNHHSHFGYVQAGVTFSKLNPGLSTLASFVDGTTQMLTWPDADGALISQVEYARQNGVALVENGRPGSAVHGEGNWGGLTNPGDRVATDRSAVCIQKNQGHAFLVYGFFPSIHVDEMATVFTAYGCDYAMQLDLNTPASSSLYLFTDRNNDTPRSFPLYRWDAPGAAEPIWRPTENSRWDFFYLLEREPKRGQ